MAATTKPRLDTLVAEIASLHRVIDVQEELNRKASQEQRCVSSCYALEQSGQTRLLTYRPLFLRHQSHVRRRAGGMASRDQDPPLEEPQANFLVFRSTTSIDISG